MASLINRVPTGRIISLHSELKYLNWRFGDQEFSLTQMKLDPNLEKTQLDFFPLAVSHEVYGRYNGKYDPYLVNPLDPGGFHLTQSVERDTQKSKSVSECATALVGLGWITKTSEGKFQLTSLGVTIAGLDYESTRFYDLFKSSVMNYGPFVGCLFDAFSKASNSEIKKSDVVIGYPNTGESVIDADGARVVLSVGSQKDSLTRTRSALFAWGMTAGFLWPTGKTRPVSNFPSEALKLLKLKSWSWSKYSIEFDRSLFEDLNIERTLDYSSMTKSTKALRERGQESVRSSTMVAETIVKNRRFAIIYTLAFAKSQDSEVSFSKMLESMQNRASQFFVEPANARHILQKDLAIAISGGVIFEQNGDRIIPITKTDLSKLLSSAPEDLRQLFTDFANEVVL
jgi:hypothetical protein